MNVATIWKKLSSLQVDAVDGTTVWAEHGSTVHAERGSVVHAQGGKIIPEDGALLRLGENVSGAPRRTACACMIIMSMLAGMVFGWPCATMATRSPTTATSTPAISAHFAEV